ncbi:MAG: hypothetical protein DVB22_000816 [Verrucomicrobia bacterium]|nr:MAG: hypothetical protein DVB22_000816 [Verrucomicrobiota bacterium]
MKSLTALALSIGLASTSSLSSCRSSPSASISRNLPQRVNLTTRPWFPPIVRQESFSCAQHAGLYYILGAEIARSRSTTASSPALRLSPSHAYLLLATPPSRRSHLIDGWILAADSGVPLESDLPSPSPTLMSGFHKYRRALLNRARSWQVLPLSDTPSLHKALHLLANQHPLATEFPIQGAKVLPFPAGTPSGCRAIVSSWGSSGPGHAMVYAGFDQSIGRDCNGDGRITSDIDITGDGRVTLADREQGAFLAVNPWGRSWADRGMAWVLFRDHSITRWPWSQYVATVQPAPSRPPRTMLKLSLHCADRSALRIAAGTPDRPLLWQPLLFRSSPTPQQPSNNVWEAFARLHQNGPHITKGPLASSSQKPVELGFILPDNFPTTNWSLSLSPSPGSRLSGHLHTASIVHLSSDGRITREFPLPNLPAPLQPLGTTWLSKPPR